MQQIITGRDLKLREAYLDNSATTCVCPAAADKMMEMLTGCYGNPSSQHQKGVDAELALERARAQIARALGCQKGEVYFTSGGTEANNIAVFGAAQALQRRGKHIVTTAIEHSSVLNPMYELERQGFDVTFLKPDEKGHIHTQDIIAAIRPDTILVSVMLVNNETGAITDFSGVKAAIKRTGSPALLHIDAVQALCKLRIHVEELGADLLTVSAHKVHGPKGAGALYIRNGMRIKPLMYGGSHEKKMRPGTEAVPSLCGFGAAVEEYLSGFDGYHEKVQALAAYLHERVKELDGAVVNSPDDALPHVFNLSVPGIRSEIMLHHLESRGVFVSGASACTKGAKSHVLTAMGISDALVDSALRISFSRYNEKEDVDQLIDGLKDGMQTILRTTAFSKR